MGLCLIQGSLLASEEDLLKRACQLLGVVLLQYFGMKPSIKCFQRNMLPIYSRLLYRNIGDNYLAIAAVKFDSGHKTTGKCKSPASVGGKYSIC